MPTNYTGDLTRISEVMQSPDFQKRETERILRAPLDGGVSMFAWSLIGALLMSAVVLVMV